MSAAGVLAALAAIHDGATARDNRLSASKFCDEFRAMGFAALQVSLELTAPGMNDQARHFGLQSIIGIVDHHWNALQPIEKQTLMATSLNLVRSGSSGDGNEPKFVKEMIARLVVEIAAREWPQHWPNLHTDLLQVSTTSLSAQHLTILVFSALAELVVKPTVKGRTFLPERRRLEIRTGLEAVLSEINSFLIAALQSPNKAIVFAAFNCITSYADWVSHTNIVSGRIVSALSTLLVMPQYFESACEPLLRICCRKPPSPVNPSRSRKKPHADRAGPVFLSNQVEEAFNAEIGAVWNATLSITSTLVRSDPFAEKARLVKLAVELLSVLSKYHRVQLEKSIQIQNLYISILGDLLKFDDAEIGIIVLSIWTPLLKASATNSPKTATTPTAANSPAIIPADQRRPILQELLMIAVNRFLATRIAVPSQDDVDDDENEIHRQYQRFRTSLLDLVRAITQEAPLLSLQMCAPHIVRLLNTKPSDHLNSYGYATGLTSSVIELQSACTLLYAVLDSPPFHSTTDQSLVSAQQSLLSSILSSNVTDSHIMMRQAQCLVLFHEILAQTPMALHAVVEKLLWMNGFVPESGQDKCEIIRLDTIAHQRRAIYCLNTLAKKPHCAAILLKWFHDLSPTMHSLCASRPSHAPLILECLVTICNALPSPVDRINYALQLIRNEISEFISLDPANFIKMYGFCKTGSAQINLDDAIRCSDQRRRLSLILNTMQYVFRSVTVPPGDADAQQLLFATISSAMNNICRIISQVHDFFSPSFLADTTMATRAILEPWVVEGDRIALQLYASDPPRKEASEQIRNQLYSIRDQCYMWISSSLACPYIYTSENQVLSLIIQTCLSDACLGIGPHALHQSRIHSILSKVWVTFLDKCPVQHPMFLFVFSRIVTILYGRLSQQWAAILEGNGSNGVAIEREVFEENALRECTRTLMQAMQSALSPHNWVAFTDKEPLVHSNRVRHDSACSAVCDDPVLITTVLNTLHVTIRVPDSVTHSKAASLIARLLPYTVSLDHTHQIYVKILESCLAMLSTMTKSVAASSGPGQDLTGVVYEILRHFAHVDRSPFNLLLSHPRVVREEAESLFEILRSSPQSTKAMRTATRNFIFAYIPERDDNLSSRIQDLPSRLVLPERENADIRPSSPANFLPDLFP